jgi:hypothetical protein
MRLVWSRLPLGTGDPGQVHPKKSKYFSSRILPRIPDSIEIVVREFGVLFVLGRQFCFVAMAIIESKKEEERKSFEQSPSWRSVE